MDEVTAEHAGGDEPVARDRADGDEPVAAELVPLDDVAKARFMGLRPIPDHVEGERRELAVALRRCFFELECTLRRYAVQRSYSASSLSRYLSGETPAPDHFANALMDDVGKKLGRPMSPQARQAVILMQRAALKSVNTRAWQIQRLEDQLAAALQEKALARTMADAVATALHEHQERVVTLEAERQALTEEVAAQRTAGIELALLRAEQHRVLTDHEALRRRVVELEAALEAAEQRVALAEQRCADLEHTLLAADAAAAAEEEADRRRTEERVARSQEELERLRREVASLRSRPAESTPPGRHDWMGDGPAPGPETGSRPETDPEAQPRPQAATPAPAPAHPQTQTQSQPQPQPQPDAASPGAPPPQLPSPRTTPASHVTVVFTAPQRPWGTWIAHRLERHGHRATLQRWDPPREVPLEQVLRDLLLARGQILFVLDEWFFDRGARQAGEWNEVLRGFVAAHADRFAAVNLSSRTLPPSAAVLEPVSLWGVDEAEAGARLTHRLALAGNRDGARRHRGATPARFPADPPAVWGAVPRRNPWFSGRDDLLGALQRRLAEAGHGSAACALIGMSGIGKTQIATEYAYRFSPDYDVIWWVHSEDRNVQRDRLGDLAVELGLRVGGEPGERIRAVREALRRGDPHARWLVVFDGWDDTDGIDVMLPQGPGHVLITSRNRGWREHTDVLEIPGFDRRESTGYLMRRAPQINAAEADEVAAEFGDVPLPLAQAAAWLGESGTEAAEYLRMVRDGRLSTVDEPSPDNATPHVSLSSWQILIDRLRRSHPQALQVLSLCTAFAPGPVPLGLLRAGPAARLPADLRWITTDPAAWTRALDTLVNFSVLVRVPGPSAGGKAAGPEEETVHMHRLVHDIVARLTDGEGRYARLKAVRDLLAEAEPGDPADSVHWPRYSVLLPHLEPSGALRSTAPRVQEAVLNCLRFCDRSGDYRAGLRLSRRVRQNWGEFMDRAGGRMLALASLEADLLRAAGRFQEAYEQSERALGQLKANPHDELAELTARSAVANGLRHQGRYHDAHHIQREVLDRTVWLVGTDDPLVLTARHDLAATLRALGRYREAYENDLMTLARREDLLGGHHLAGLASANAVTRGQRLLGMYGAALSRQVEVARRHEEALGARHPRTLDADIELALCRRHGDPDGPDGPDGGTSLAELVDRSVEIHGREHHVTLQCLSLHADAVREQGDLGRARALGAEAETGYRALFGPAHPVSLGAVTNTALVLLDSGQHSAAVAMLESARAGLIPALGQDHPWVLGCDLNTAAAYRQEGDLVSAVALGRDALSRAQAVLGAEHPLTLSCQLALAADLRGLPLREDDEALVLEEDAVNRLAAALGPQHPRTLAARRRVRPVWSFEPYVD
ncbi:tetratricopeptide repeat protein [Streptomyces venezuelae]|uniref:FxSxx-COOH system tetratricopeptide repeat protein n=3 Tax=Streptomyces venezuelae TaxID=54571 RepID=UPI00123CE550|nr:FxSxx-COOH system tetratricopeptide repeat protein [Streptomyces venezuelae]QES15213.1 tetratricopeptide repeat protein [Streptomyces venezuelae]